MMTVLTFFVIQFFYPLYSYKRYFVLSIFIVGTVSFYLYSVFVFISFIWTYLFLFPAHKRYDHVSFDLFRKFIEIELYFTDYNSFRFRNNGYTFLFINIFTNNFSSVYSKSKPFHLFLRKVPSYFF